MFLAASTVRTWNYGDIVWLSGAYVVRANVDYKDWIPVHTYVNATRTRMPVDVAINC